MARKSQKTLDNEILSRIQKRVSEWFEYYSENNHRFRKTMEFVYLEDGQWTDGEIKEYDLDHRPRLTFNMLPRYITNLSAEFAQNTPDLEVRSEHFTEVDQQSIDLITNMTRHISFDSRNDVVYQTALENAIIGGYGAFRIVVEREKAGSFQQVPRYESVYDPTTCFWDPIARLVDKSDGNCCGTTVTMSKKEFSNRYPGAQIPDASDYLENYEYFTWVTEDQVTVVDYWEKVPFKIKVALLNDGSVIDGDNAEEIVKQKNKELNILKKKFPGGDTSTPVDEYEIVKLETHEDYRIIFYRVSRTEILERCEWDGKRLPIIFQGGNIKWVKGRERTYGLVAWMKDAQRSYNYARSEYLYRLKLTRFEKFLVTPENIAGYENEWRNPHIAKSALPYKRGTNGEVPIVIPAQSIGNDLQAEMNRSLEDLQMIPGRFDPNMGAQGNEVSGIAIANRQRGGNLNVKEFFVNAEKAIESGARVIVDLIPKLYDSERVVSITTKDGKEDMIPINSANTAQIPDKEAFFNVRVQVGSSFEIQQSENAAKLLEFARNNPQFAQLTSDLIIKNLDLQQGPQLVERIQRFGIPQIAALEGSKDPIVIQNAQKSQQNPQQEIQQQMAQLQIASQQLDLQKKQQDMILDHMSAQDDRVKAMASRITALANMLNAQTNQAEAAVKGVQESRRIQAEEDKAQLEEQTQVLKTLTTLSKGEQQNGQINL